MVRGYCRARNQISYLFKKTPENRNIRAKVFSSKNIPKYSPNFLLFSPLFKMLLNMRSNPPFENFYDRYDLELRDGEEIALDFHPLGSIHKGVGMAGKSKKGKF